MTSISCDDDGFLTSRLIDKVFFSVFFMDKSLAPYQYIIPILKPFFSQKSYGEVELLVESHLHQGRPSWPNLTVSQIIRSNCSLRVLSYCRISTFLSIIQVHVSHISKVSSRFAHGLTLSKLKICYIMYHA